MREKLRKFASPSRHLSPYLFCIFTSPFHTFHTHHIPAMSKRAIHCLCLFLLAILFILPVASRPATTTSPQPSLSHVHPLNWWAGMKHPELQILLHGTNISACSVRLDNTSDIALLRTVRTESPNYLILYLDVRHARPQTFDIVLVRNGKSCLRQPYEIRPRTPLRLGSFDASDVLYLLIPDRFANGNTTNDDGLGMKDRTLGRHEPYGRHGGDLAGMDSHLAYLHDLGITAIWSTPILTNDMPEGSYHGYAITDYYQVDPRIGSNEEFKRFVAHCHQQGIKYIMDLVFNHCGAAHFLYTDLPGKDWFNFDARYVQTNYKLGTLIDPHSTFRERRIATDGWFTREMPDLNQRNPLVMDYLMQTSIWWTEYAGIDGIRQDTYPYCDVEAMAQWNRRLEEEYPGYNVVGETWINYNVGVAPWQKGSRLATTDTELKTVMDFPLMALLGKVCDEETDDWDHGFARLWDYFAQDAVYENPLHLLTFLSNHDTDRFCATEAQSADTARYRQALAILLFARGIPQLYYGDEIGLWSNKSQGDGLLRQDFPGGWPNDERNAFTPQGRTAIENARYDYTRRLLQFRKGRRAVSEGNMTQFTIRNGIYCFSRKQDDETVTVMLNGTSHTATANLCILDEALPTNLAYEVISGDTLTLGDTLDIPPRGVRILYFEK